MAGHPNGANASATFYSSIETAKARDLKTYRYLRFLFEKIFCASTSADYQALLAQAVDPAQMEYFFSPVVYQTLTKNELKGI